MIVSGIFSVKHDVKQELMYSRMADADLNVQKERHGSTVKRLVGHSGPVYGLSFSHDNKYLLSCSEDKTGKDQRSYKIFVWKKLARPR
jgi:WD40 repeat protein